MSSRLKKSRQLRNCDSNDTICYCYLKNQKTKVHATKTTAVSKFLKNVFLTTMEINFLTEVLKI